MHSHAERGDEENPLPWGWWGTSIKCASRLCWSLFVLW